MTKCSFILSRNSKQYGLMLKQRLSFPSSFSTTSDFYFVWTVWIRVSSRSKTRNFFLEAILVALCTFWLRQCQHFARKIFLTWPFEKLDWVNGASVEHRHVFSKWILVDCIANQVSEWVPVYPFQHVNYVLLSGFFLSIHPVLNAAQQRCLQFYIDCHVLLL